MGLPWRSQLSPCERDSGRPLSPTRCAELPAGGDGPPGWRSRAERCRRGAKRRPGRGALSPGGFPRHPAPPRYVRLLRPWHSLTHSASFCAQPRALLRSCPAPLGKQRGALGYPGTRVGGVGRAVFTLRGAGSVARCGAHCWGEAGCWLARLLAPWHARTFCGLGMASGETEVAGWHAGTGPTEPRLEASSFGVSDCCALVGAVQDRRGPVSRSGARCNRTHPWSFWSCAARHC